MGGSTMTQVFGQLGDEAPDLMNEDLMKDFFDAIEQLHEAGIVLAHHDISDGGLFISLVEMYSWKMRHEWGNYSPWSPGIQSARRWVG